MPYEESWEVGGDEIVAHKGQFGHYSHMFWQGSMIKLCMITKMMSLLIPPIWSFQSLLWVVPCCSHHIPWGILEPPCGRGVSGSGLTWRDSSGPRGGGPKVPPHHLRVLLELPGGISVHLSGLSENMVLHGWSHDVSTLSHSGYYSFLGGSQRVWLDLKRLWWHCLWLHCDSTTSFMGPAVGVYLKKYWHQTFMGSFQSLLWVEALCHFLIFVRLLVPTRGNL